MTSSVGLRATALAGVALVAVVIALALSHDDGGKESLPEPAGQWYTTLAAPYTESKQAAKSACGVVVTDKTPGVAHSVLPCGVKVYIRLGDKQVLTQVIDRGHIAPGREFDVTPALAKVLGLQGTQTIQWRFAR